MEFKFIDPEGLQYLWSKLKALFNGKVDKVTGKGLSTNDYTTTEKNKLSGIASGAEVNQNAFSNIKVGSTTVSADAKTDTLEIAAGSNITITPDATNDKITIAATNTTYGAAGSSLGLVKSGGDVTISSGTITVNDDSHNHTIANVDGLQTALDGKLSTSGTAVKATADSSGQNIADTYIKSLSVNGRTITYTKGDGDTGTITTQDTNTTYSNMKGATTSAAGSSGLVPAPSSGAANRYLRSDGTWSVPPDTNTTYSDMKGATSSANGAHGLVPQPDAGEQAKFLRGDGTWQTPANTTYADMKGATADAAGSHGLVPAPAAGAQGKFLRGDGTWQTPANTTYGAAGTNLGLVKSGGDVTISNGTITVNDDSHNHTISNVDGLQSALDGKLSTSGNAASATKLANARTFSITGGATASGVSFNGTGNVTLNVTALDASKLTGTVPIDRLPAGALERLVTVENQAARFSLTTSNVQLGDTVQQLDTGIMYIVVNTGELDNANGYKEYTAATATKVPWSGVTDKPTSFTPSSHTHTIANVTGLQSALDGKLSTTGNAASASKLSTARTISLGGDVTGSTTFDGSGNVTITATVADDSHNHTIANIDNLQTTLNGKASTSHTHNYAGSSSAGGAATSAAKVNGIALTNQNLNDYHSGVNFYYAAGGNSCTNKPSGIDNFGMFVFQSAGGWWTQILYGSDDDIYTRRWVSDTWTSWNKLYTTTNKPTASEIGAAASSHTHNYAGSSSAGGAANSANKLTTARTITLSGDASGSVSFDGSGNVTLSVSVKDDSHNHTIANIDGLQDALDDITAGSVSSAPKWTTARNINGMSVDGSANRFNYGTCSTAAATAAKTVACTGFTLATGSEITVKFTVTNTVANPTLNVNSTGAKAIYYNGAAISAGYLKANKTYTFRYNGTQYDLVGDIDTNTTYSLSSFGITATAAELNKLDGVTATATELNYVDGVTSNIQTQLNGKLSTSGTAAKATADANGQNIADTYIKALSVSGRTITYTKGDGGTGTITTQDTNTTYSNMTGASSSAAGKAGLVPAPSAGSQAKFLRGDGTWQTPTNTTYTNMTGATSSAAGKSGLVPAPAAGKQTSFLRGDGTWVVPTNTDTKATQTNTTTNADYRVVLSTNANDTTETNTLRKSVNFQANPSTGAFYAKGYERIDISNLTVDIDDYTLSSGSPHIMRYIEKTSGGASKITNIPVTGQPFILDVELIRWASTTDYITVQTFRSTSAKTTMYYRTCNSGTWTAWTTSPLTYSLSSFGITATAAELNKLDGVTATATELNYVDGVTSNIQTQLNGKASTSHTHNYAGSSSAGGAANSVAKLSTARTIRTNLGSTSTASFDGSANITPGVTGTLAVGNGGTGATTAAAARTKLGFSGIVVSSTEPTTQNTNEFWLRSY